MEQRRQKTGGAAASSPLYSTIASGAVRVHGASPFVREQSPGRRIPTSPDVSASPLRHSVNGLFRQRSHNSATAQPTSAQDDLESSSSSSSSVASTHVLTATPSTFTAVCSLDDPQSSAPTRSSARDFIMDRFLPAAHAIACDSPQPPTGRLLYPSPSTFYRSNPQRSSLPSRSPTSPYPSRGRIVTPVFDDSLDDDADDDPEDDSGPQSKNMCGMFSFGCANSVVRSHCISDKSFSIWSKQPKKTAPRRMTLGDMLKEDQNAQEEDMVTQPLRENAQKKRAPKLREHVAASRSSPLHRVCLPEGAEAPKFYHAPSRLSPSMCVPPYRNEPTTSPFLQSKRFLGFPGDRSVNDVNREADGSASCFETPRASLSDTKIVVSKNGYNYLSPFSSVLPQQNRSPISESRFQIGPSSSSNAYLAERIAPEAGHHANSDPARASGYQRVAVDPVLRQPCHNENGEIAAHEEKAALNFKSNLSTNSPNRYFETKEWLETDPPVAMLSLPLPKSPSASWRWRSIPPVTTNRSSTSYPRKASMLQAKMMSSNDAPKDAKWETIVKGSQIQAGHLRSSKELLSGPAQPEIGRR